MYLTPQQAADKLGVCKKTIFRRIEDGSLKAYALGAKTIRIDEKDLDAFLHGDRRRKTQMPYNT